MDNLKVVKKKRNSSPLTEEHKRKISLAHIGIRPSQETRDKMSRDRKGKPSCITDNGRKRVSESSKERWKNQKYRDNFIEKAKCKIVSEDVKLKLSKANIGRKQTDEHKKLTGELSKKRWQNSEFREKVANAKLEANWIPDDEWKDKHRVRMKKLWLNPEYAHKVLSGVCKHPNTKENQLMDIINEVAPNQYRFTGDGSFSIYNLHPDFTNINGQKKVIEHYGKHWHEGQNAQDRIDRFAEFGYECLVIWEQELKEPENVKKKVGLFHVGHQWRDK